jgi:putative hydroxymethylpyrimidine transport system substrate-binding protein
LSRLRPALILAAALLAGLALAACGTKDEKTAAPGQEAYSVMLDFFPNADHAGLFQAKADGEFAKAGLDVKLRTPSDPAAPLKLLEAGKVDLAISYEPELLLARDKGAQLVAVAALVQKPLTSIISLPAARIVRPAQLRGKKVATAGIPYQSAYLKAVLEKAGLDGSAAREVNVGFNLVPALLSKRADAILGGFWNYEGVQLTRAHRRPRVIRIERAGVPTYDELVIVARRSEVTGNGSRVRRFLRALARGQQAVRADPVAAARTLVKANPDLDAGLQLASIRATLPVFFPADTKRPFGFMDPGEWATYGAWMLDHQLITKPPHAGSALTNEFLPGQGI